MPVSIFGSTSNTGGDRKVSRYNAKAEPMGDSLNMTNKKSSISR